MRKLFPLLLIILAACNHKNDQPAKKDIDTDYLVSLDGIGAVKNEMSQEELEKLLNQKIPLTNPRDTISGSWQDSAFVRFKEADLRLTFTRAYIDNDSFHMRITDMKTSSPLCKTKEGIGIGSDKQEIINAFEDQWIYIQPEYEDTTYTTLSKIMTSITVREAREGREIIFYLKNNKVYALKVGQFYDDEE